MIGKFIDGKLVYQTMGESLIDSALEGADMLLEGFDRDGLRSCFGEQDMRNIGKLKYAYQGRALQRCLAHNEQGTWLRNYVEATFSQYFGQEGRGSIHACYLNKDQNPGRLRTELECFKSAMVMAKNYTKEHPEVIVEGAY